MSRIGHGRGDHGLVVGPPKLHVVLVGLGWLPAGVDEVQKAAELVVPSRLRSRSEYLLGGGMEGSIAPVVGFLHEEPAALDVVAGVHHAACRIVKLGLAVGVDVLERAAKVGTEVLLDDSAGAFVGVPVVLFLRLQGRRGALSR